jgi:hypothetical protein
MGTNQTTFNTRPGVGYPGMVANTEPKNVISRTVESAAGITFGQPAFRGSDDHGCVVGVAFAATSVGAADAGNAGAATITAAPAVTLPAKEGVYKVVHSSAGATGAFDVYDPDGLFVGNGVTGTEFVGGGLTFTVTDAGADPAVGASYTITVSYGAGVGAMLGLVVMDPSVPANASTPDKVPQNYTASIMDQGLMWVTAGGTVTDGAPVYWKQSTLRYTASAADGVRVPNAVFDMSGVDTDLVRVAIRKRLGS